MQKYILTDETKEVDGVTLHRVKALADFANVKVGDLGGWIETEKNLSQDGDAWVCDSALVFGDARVCGNAYVCGDARVSKNGDILTVSNIGSRNDCTTFFRCAKNKIKVSCGCFMGNLEDFRAKVVKTHGNNIHAKNYLLAAKLAEQMIFGIQKNE